MAVRWAGTRAPDGSLLACIVDATATPSVGFVAALAVRPDVRRHGHGQALLAWATNELLQEHPRVGLWYEGNNTAAIAMYERLGFTQLPMTGAQFV